MYTGTIGGGADPVCRSIPGGASVVPAPVFYPCLRGYIPQCSLDGGQLEVGPAHSQAGGCQFLLAAVCRAPNFVLGRECVNGGGHWRSLEVTGGHWRSIEVTGGHCCTAAVTHSLWPPGHQEDGGRTGGGWGRCPGLPWRRGGGRVYLRL